jgi:hypothetical protein
LQKHSKVDDPLKVEAGALRFLFWLLEGFSTYGFLHAAEAMGRETLSKTFDALVAKHPANEGVKLIDLAIRIQVSQKFPDELAQDVFKKTRSNFVRNIIRNMVVRHMHLFPMDPITQQQLCNAFDIRLIDQSRGVKLLPSPPQPPRRPPRRKKTKKKGRKP